MTKHIKFQSAFAQVDITPDFPVTLIGGEPTISQGILHPIVAQVVLMQWEKRVTSLITIDNLGLTIELAETLRNRVARQLGGTKESVMLCFSHTHNAPQPTVGALNGERYFDFMAEKINQGVAQALTELTPCLAGWGLTETDIGVNRRKGCSQVDKRLGALKIANLDGQPLGVILRLTAHPNCLMNIGGMISSDYFHFVRQQLADYFGCPVMLIQGSAGNIKVTGTDTLTGGTLADAERVASEIANSLENMSIEMTEVNEFQLFSKEIQFTSDVPSLAEAEQIASDAQKECGIDGSWWLKECLRLRELGFDTQVSHQDVQFLSINEGQFCGVADELFCDLALDAMAKIDNPLFFLNGYTNGCTGYLPTEAEWLRGGYEIIYSYLLYFSFHGHVMPFRKETADQLVKFVVTNRY